MGKQVEWLKPFAGKPKSVKTFVLWRDEGSLMQRQLRVRGSIGTYRQEERLHIISASIPALKSMKFSNFKGSSAGSMMGPIILPPMWSLLWPQKKILFTPANLIPVGGRAGPDDELPEDHNPTKPRDKDTMEPIFSMLSQGASMTRCCRPSPWPGFWTSVLAMGRWHCPPT